MLRIGKTPALALCARSGICLAATLVLAVATAAQPPLPPKASAATNARAPRAVAARQVLVQFKPGAKDAEIARSLAAHGAKVHKHIRTEPMREKAERGIHVLETGKPLEATLRELAADPTVLFAEPNWVYRHQATADDPYFAAGNLWGTYGDNTHPANVFGSQAARAWAAGYTGTNAVCVGIIDEGVDWQHPDLAANVWSNAADPVDGVDNDGNGYIDDVHGWNFHANSGAVYDVGGDDHGTHVAGTIGASGANSIGIAGVNWNVTMIPAKFLGPDGGTTADAIEAVDYFVDLKQRHGLNIVALNNSWGGGGYSQGLHAAINRAAKAGILFIAAAGNGDAYAVGINNDAYENYPSNYDTTRATYTEPAVAFNGVIAVAAIDSSGNLGGFSNFGATSVHLGAPGVGIWSTIPGGGYAAYNGTSMATPHVTGAAALYASTHPAASAAQVRHAILGSVTPTESLVGTTTTGGRLNVANIIAPGTSPGGDTNTHTAPALGAARMHTNNTFRFSVSGAVNEIYDIQVSTNTTDWSTVATVTNRSGLINLAEQQTATGAPQKFYRALAR
jgi:thermitase